MGFLLGLAVIIAAFAAYVATRPDEFRLARTATIAAPPSAIFPHINDLRQWEAWSPWAKLDPNAKNEFGGPAAGAGAYMHWSGNNKIGEGKMTITESRPNEFIQFRL